MTFAIKSSDRASNPVAFGNQVMAGAPKWLFVGLLTISGCTPEGAAPRSDARVPGSRPAKQRISVSLQPPLLTDIGGAGQVSSPPRGTQAIGSPSDLNARDAIGEAAAIDAPSGGRFTLAAAPITKPIATDDDDSQPEVVPTPEPDDDDANVAPPKLKPAAELIPTPAGTPAARADGNRVRQPTFGGSPADSTSDPAAKISLNNTAGKGDPKRAPAESEGSVPRNDLRSEIQSVADDALRKPGAAGEPEPYQQWPTPAAALVVTGQQHGYIEPCGCTGLTRQKGGVARRFTFLERLREDGWQLLPIDTGNLIRRFGRQGEIKFHRSLEALREMGYVSVGFGPDDVRLSVNDLIQEAADMGEGDPIYASANVVLFGDPTLMPSHQVVTSGGMKVGVANVLDPDFLEAEPSDEISIKAPLPSARAALEELRQANPDFRVLTFFGKEEDAQDLVRQVPGFDLLVVSGGYGEPTFQPLAIEGSKTKMIVTGNKGMYAGLVGLYPDQPMRYARVALTHEFSDAPEMRQLMKEYQQQLRDLGLEGLGIKPIPHPKDDRFVGSAKCGECHTTAYEIWETSPHVDATASIVEPKEERGDVPRHFDPECISCHVTGWNPQNYYPYTSGYLSLQASAHLTGSGCENCHGPGADHSAAELADSGIDQAKRDELRLGMRLPLEKARDKCMECHDLDNSPDFHEEDAFEDDYWPRVEHYGLD